ncbi:hypothetical protein [Limnobacter sp.]
MSIPGLPPSPAAPAENPLLDAVILSYGTEDIITPSWIHGEEDHDKKESS